MHEWLLAVPPAVGFLAERGATLAFNIRHRPSWRRELEDVAEGSADWLAVARGHNLVRQAEVQTGLLNDFRGAPERIASSRLCYLKGIAALVFGTRMVVELWNNNLWEAYQSFSIAFPLMIGAVLDGMKAGDLDPETVLNRSLPAWRRFKKIL